jgi:putative endonuclease
VTDGAYVYILRCADGSYYCGSARRGSELRLAEHDSGYLGGYTSTRRPVVLVYSEWFDRIVDAIAAERQIKGWSRAKKEALLRGDFQSLHLLSQTAAPRPRPWFETPRFARPLTMRAGGFDAPHIQTSP